MCQCVSAVDVHMMDQRKRKAMLSHLNLQAQLYKGILKISKVYYHSSVKIAFLGRRDLSAIVPSVGAPMTSTCPNSKLSQTNQTISLLYSSQVHLDKCLTTADNNYR